MEKVVQGVLESIRCQDLLHAGDRSTLACSGGADSVALLRIMLELRPELGIVSVVHLQSQIARSRSRSRRHSSPNLPTSMSWNYMWRIATSRPSGMGP